MAGAVDPLWDIVGGAGRYRTDQHPDNRHEGGGRAGTGIGSAGWAGKSDRGGQPVRRSPVLGHFRASPAHFWPGSHSQQSCPFRRAGEKTPRQSGRTSQAREAVQAE